MESKYEGFSGQLRKCFDGKAPPFIHFKGHQQFADYIGVSRQTVGFWLNGQRLPQQDMLVQISEKLGVSADWLTGVTDDKRYSNSEAVKVTEQYTGLSHAAIDMLHKINSFDHVELAALSYLLERPLFYKQILGEVWKGMESASGYLPDPDMDEAFEKLTEEDVSAILRLQNLGVKLFTPEEQVEYLSNNCGLNMSFFLKRELSKDMGTCSADKIECDLKEEKEYFQTLEGMSKLRERIRYIKEHGLREKEMKENEV